MGERVSIMDFLSDPGNKLLSTNVAFQMSFQDTVMTLLKSLMCCPLGQLTKELVGND